MRTDKEFWLTSATIQTDLLTFMAIHGALCLALRHPQYRGTSRDMVVKVVKKMGQELVRRKALTPEQLKEAEREEARAGSEDLL